MDCPAANQTANAIFRQLLAIQYADHARHCRCTARIDGFYFCVGMGTANKNRMFHAGNDHIVRIATLACDKTLVFLARHSSADAFNSHQNSPL